jgi:hypothetical protein
LPEGIEAAMIVSQNQACSPPVGAGEGFLTMIYWKRCWMRGIGLPVAVLGLALGGCAMDRVSDIMPRASDFTTFEWNPYSRASMSVAPTFERTTATAADYVSADGSCAAAEGGGEQRVAGGVALQMTECAVVRTLGAPERVEIGANERGERVSRLVYSRGDRAGLYHFTSGHLTQIERVAAPAAPAKPQKPAAKPKRAVS